MNRILIVVFFVFFGVSCETYSVLEYENEDSEVFYDSKTLPINSDANQIFENIIFFTDVKRFRGDMYVFWVGFYSRSEPLIEIKSLYDIRVCSSFNCIEFDSVEIVNKLEYSNLYNAFKLSKKVATLNKDIIEKKLGETNLFLKFTATSSENRKKEIKFELKRNVVTRVAYDS